MRGLIAAEVQNKTPQNAIKVLETMSAENPSAAAPRLMMAEYYLYNREPDRASSLAREVLDKDSDSPDAYLVIGSAELVNGRPSIALSAFQTMVAKAPNSATGHFHLARTLAQLGNIDAARREAEQAVSLQATYLAARGLAASLAIGQNDFSVAAKHIEQLKANEQGEAKAYELDGDLRRKQNRPQRIPIEPARRRSRS